jgi:hypothetical protein
MKYSNFKRYKFSTITKNLNTLKNSFLKALRLEDIKRHFQNHFNFRKLNNQLNSKKLYNYLNFRKLYNHISFKKFNFLKIIQKIPLKKYKNLQIYLVALPILVSFLYLVTPTFFNYEKSKIEQIICKNKNIICSIKGKVNYSFYPTPRIKIKDLIIYNSPIKKNIFIKVDDASVKLSVKNLVTKKKHKFNKIILNNFKINIDLKNLKKYKNIFEEKNNFTPIKFLKGEILLLDKDNYVASVYDANLNFKFAENSSNIKIKGKFFDDDLNISIKSKIIDNKMSTNIILKMPDFNLLTKVKFLNLDNEKDIITGDIFIKKDKNKFTGIFNYKNDEIIINKSNLRNIFLDGKLNGKIKLLPFFDFNLDLNLNSVNFTKLYSYFLALDAKKQKSIFKINKKINGKINLSSDRIYSSYNLVKSFESRIAFSNGNISIEQFLVNLGKLGAADIIGTINNDKKFSNFKYESNIFIDNEKKFLSKFGIYKRQNIPSNLFVSGNFDLKNAKAIFYEISNNKKLTAEDINFIEQEFNDYMLEDDYKNLFLFPKFKDFIKSVTAKDN